MRSSSLEQAVRVVPRPGPQPWGVDLVDDIEGVRVQLATNQRARPARCSRAGFRFPIDVAYELSPLVLWTLRFNPVLVRERDGSVCAELTNRGAVSLSSGEYTVDVASLGLKVYLYVEGSLEISYTEERGRIIDCRAAETVRLGLRSFHDAPAATVTTTDQPRDVMRAVSCLGSALKTTSCERSFPTLRGHPPLFEQGERFQDPAGLERTAETASVRIEVPPTLETIYPVAPLAYYLNAAVVPGESPRLVAGDTTIPLDRGEGVEHGVAQRLKHIFTLDCITRTEGLYPIILGEREIFTERLADTGRDIDFEALYDQPLPQQLQRYNTIPFEFLEDLVPRWPLTADVRPVGEYLPYLPFVVASLGTIRCLSTTTTDPTPPPPEIEAFYRNRTHRADNTDFSRVDHTSAHPSTRSPEETPDALSTDIHGTPESDSITQLWLADGYPIQGAKPTLAAFKRRFDAITADGCEVAVINNDVQMEAESDVADLYDQRERIPFDVTIHKELSKQALSAVFAEEYDLVHYVGHVDERGLQCADGWLDAHTLETVGTRMFVLNGCRSYEQGMALAETGAVGGLCTLTDVGNTPATQIGRTVARLVNMGFSLGSALDIIGEDSLAGQQYMIVGDPGTAIVENQNETRILAEIAPTPDEKFTLELYGYPSIHSQIGMIYAPAIDDYETYYINSGYMTTITISPERMMEHFRHDRFPVRLDGTLSGSDTISLDSIDSID